MKKIILFSALLCASSFAFSQDFKPFRVGIGTGYAVPGGSGAKAGALLYLEPSYRVNDAFAIGLRMELAVVARGTAITGTSFSSFDGKVSASGSYTINGQYYFSNGGFRPFVGAGVGIYNLASASFDQFSNGNQTSTNTGDVVSAGTKIGFYPRVGFDASHFTFNIEYNVIGKSTSAFSTTDSQGNVTTGTSTTKNGYLAVKIGFFIGGGRN